MIQVEHKGRVIATQISLADNFWMRLSGYMFRSKPHTAGILFEPTNAIHTFFMRFPIDVIFMDKHSKIIRVYRSMVPWRHTWMHFSARKVLELPAGKFPSDIKEGDILEVRNV